MNDTGAVALALTTRLVRSLVQEGLLTKEQAATLFDNLVPSCEPSGSGEGARELVRAARESIIHLRVNSWK